LVIEEPNTLIFCIKYIFFVDVQFLKQITKIYAIVIVSIYVVSADL